MTPGFAIPGWLGIAVAVVVAGVIVWQVVSAIKGAQLPWKPLPGFPDAKYIAPQGYDAGRISAALVLAASALSSHTKWSLASIMGIVANVQVMVIGAESWTDIWGRKVGGEQIGSTLWVGLSLTALCHELAHLCQFRIDNTIDNTHATWKDNGVWRALDEFQVGRSVPSPVFGIRPLTGAQSCRFKEPA